MEHLVQTKSTVADVDRSHVEAPLGFADSPTAVTNVRLLWESRRLLARWTAAGMVLAIALAYLIPKRYESTARIMPPQNQSMALKALAGLSGMGGGLGSLMGDLAGLQTSSALFVGVLQSQTVEDHLIAQFSLQKVYSTKTPEDTRKALKSQTDIAEDRKSGIISVTVTDKSPERARDMAQGYVNELDKLVGQLDTSAARREREFLETRLQVVKKELEDSEQAFSQFSSKNTTLDLREQGKAMLDATAQVEAQLIAAQTQVQALRQVYSDDNVRVRAAHAQVAELQKKLNNLGGSKNAVPDSSSDNFSYPSIRQLPVLGVTYADLYRRTKVAETVFELLTREYEMARVEEAKEIPTVKELDVPTVPQKKSFPPRLVIMLLGTMLSFACATTFVFGRQAWEHMEPDDPRKLLISDIVSSGRHRLVWRKALAARSHRELPDRSE